MCVFVDIIVFTVFKAATIINIILCSWKLSFQVINCLGCNQQYVLLELQTIGKYTRLCYDITANVIPMVYAPY